MAFVEGDVLAGKYRIERSLGAGGMGLVVAAQHLQLGTGVAIKLLRPEACADVAVVARFLREARAAARLQSEHVARVVDVGTLDSGAPYMVMELLRGEDLAHVLHGSGALPVDRAVQYVLEASEAVAEAHALGIVHRDLKPANLFLASRPDGSPYVKVLDFGIAKISDVGQEPGAPTATGAILGTPYYMSPEQIRSTRDVDARTDVWSLGACLYELVTGRKPFDAETLPAVFVRIVNDAPLSPRALCPELPGGLEAVILACLEKDRSRRVPSVAELARRLAPYAPAGAAGLVERVRRLAPGERAPDGGTAATAPASPSEPMVPAATGRAWSRPGEARPRDRIALVVLGAAAAMIVVSVIVVPRWLARGAPSAAVTPSAPARGATPVPDLPPSIALAPPSAPPSASAPASAAASVSSPPRRPVPAPRHPGKRDETSPTVE